jgi:integrase
MAAPEVMEAGMSVRKRQWTTASGEERETWVATYTDGHGKRHLKSFAKKKDADAFAATTHVEVRAGVHVADADTVTIAEAGDLWLRAGRESGLERTTLDQRGQHLHLHIAPMIANTKLNKVTAPFVRTFQDRLRDEGRSPAMVKRATVSLGSILADAQSRGLVIRNAVHELSRARSGKRGTEKRAKAPLKVGVDIPTTAEVKALLGAATGRWRPLLVAAVFTGLRASELRGLRWDDVDLTKAILTVRQRADRYRDIGSPKSSAGHRTIPLPPMVVNTLREWKLTCPKGEEKLVFPNTEGGVEFHQNMVQRGLWPIELAAGLTRDTGRKDDDGAPVLAPRYPGLHALRHWFASWCINRKAEGGLELSAKAVQSRMGHSSIQVTFDTYGHLFPAADEGAEMAAAEQPSWLLRAS